MYLFFLVGQRVIPDLFFTCGNCYYCHVEPDIQRINHAELLDVLNDEAFAEYSVAPAENLFVLPNQVSFETGNIALCHKYCSPCSLKDKIGSK